MKNDRRLARLEQTAGVGRCPKCGHRLPPAPTEIAKNVMDLWELATVSELQTVRDILRDLEARREERNHERTEQQAANRS